LRAGTTNRKIQADHCRVRRELAEQFATIARLYSEAVVRLTSAGVSGRVYDELRAAAIEAQRRAETAQIVFEEHVETHGCGRTDHTELKATVANTD
jgi:hypothetical protein